MIANGTCSIAAASARTWITATFIYASQSTRTFWIGRTLWSTIWSAADIIWYTWANGRFTNDTALGIRSAWWWYTRFRRYDVWTSYWVGKQFTVVPQSFGRGKEDCPVWFWNVRTGFDRKEWVQLSKFWSVVGRLFIIITPTWIWTKKIIVLKWDFKTIRTRAVCCEMACLTFFLFNTSNERIACIANITTANRIVVNHLTFGVLATSAGTWILALLIDAWFVLRTFGTEYTFGMAIWWCTNVGGQTWADRMLIQCTTLTVEATWRWMAWFSYNWWFITN